MFASDRRRNTGTNIYIPEQPSIIALEASAPGGGAIADPGQLLVLDGGGPPTWSGCALEPIVVHLSLGTYSTVVTWAEPTATDNVAVDSVTVNYPSGSVFHLANSPYRVEYFAKDLGLSDCRPCIFDVVLVYPEILHPVTCTLTRISWAKCYETFLPMSKKVHL